MKSLEKQKMGRGRLCCGVFSCKNPGVHRLPKDEALKAQWISAARIDMQRKVPYRGLPFRKFTYVCEDHFTPSDYIDAARKSSRLKRTAVPSIFPWSPPCEPKVDEFPLTFDPSKVSRDYTRTEAVTFIAEIPNQMEEETTEASDDPLNLYNEKVKREDFSPMQLEESEMVTSEDFKDQTTKCHFPFQDNLNNGAHTSHHDNISKGTQTCHNNINKDTHDYTNNKIDTTHYDCMNNRPRMSLGNMNNKAHTHDDNMNKVVEMNKKTTQLDKMNKVAHTGHDNMNNTVHTLHGNADNELHTLDDDSSNSEIHHDDNIETSSLKEVAVQTYERLRPFSVQSYLKHDKAIEFFTGFESYEKLTLVFESLGKQVNNIEYFRGPPATKLGMGQFEQFFMTLIVLRHDKPFIEMSMMYLIPFKQVSNIFVSWIRFMSRQWRKLDLWVEKKTMKAYFNMPLNCPDEYHRTRIVMCSHARTELPKTQQAKISKYRSDGMVLIGITQSGLITFVSPTDGGSACDGKISKTRDVLKQIDKVKHQDNSTSFCVKVSQASVASRRVQKEVMGFLRKFKFLSRLNAKNTMQANDIVYICAMLVNFQTLYRNPP